MAKKRNILVITGTRADYGLLRSTMDAIKAHPRLSLKLLVTGMHTLRQFGYTKREVERDYKVDATIPVREGSDMLSALVQEISGVRAYCLAHRPDCVLVLGDRDEAFAAAVVAAHLNIPLAHIHGGDVSGAGVDDALRHSITKMAHIHFPGSPTSAARIKAMGEESWRIVEAGSVVMDGIKKLRPIPRIALARALGLDAKRPWLIVLQHPTAFDVVPLKTQIRETLAALGAFPEHEKVLLYPNSDEGSAVYISALKAQKGPRYHLFASLPREQFASLLKEGAALVGNSSAGILEIALLGTPSVNIGNRQGGRERGAYVISVPYKTSAITKAIRAAIALKKKQGGKPFSSPYGIGRAGSAIAAALHRLLSRKDVLTKAPSISN